MKFDLKISILTFAGILALNGCAKVNEMTASVLGGHDAPADSLTINSTVAIGKYQQGKFKVTCTGTLISKDIVLTAAHCVIPFEMDDVEMTLYFGNDRDNYDLSLEKTTSVWIYNSGYQKVRSKDGEIITGINDVAVIKFDLNLPTNFKPVSIIAPLKQLAPETELTIAGWGTTVDGESQIPAKLQEAKVTLNGYWYTHLLVDQRRGVGVCFGDSGGPAYLKNNRGDLTVVGITRGAYNNADNCSGFAEFTNVSTHAEFILQAVSDLNGTAPNLDSDSGALAQ
ncbi:MAG: S1 family peptidase [Bacillota bacterium]